MFITATYSSKLVSFLAVANEKLPFETLEEVVYADDYLLYIYDGGMLRSWFEVILQYDM